jgi:hypothetical protein
VFETSLLEFFSVDKCFLANITFLLLVNVGFVSQQAVAFSESSRANVARETSLVLVKDPDVT